MEQESQNMWQQSSQSPLVFTAKPQNHFASCNHINCQQLQLPNGVCQDPTHQWSTTAQAQHHLSSCKHNNVTEPSKHRCQARLECTFVKHQHMYANPVCGSMYMCVGRYTCTYSTCAHGIASTSIIHSTTVTHSYTMSSLDTMQSSATQHHELQSLCESSDGSDSSPSPSSSSPPCT